MNRIEALESGLSDAALADFVHPEDPGWIQAPEDLNAEALDAYEAFREARTYPVAFVARKDSPVDRVARLTWNELAEILSSPATGPKDGPGWMPVDIEPGPRKGERVRSVSLLCLDIEAETQGQGEDKRVIGPEPPAFAAVQSEIAARNWRAILHTSYSHTPDHPRYRIVFDVTRPLFANEVRPLGEHVALLLGLRDACDLKCLEPARLFYLPRVRDAEENVFQYAAEDGEAVDVDALLFRAATIRRASHEGAQRQIAAASSEEEADVIGAFNRRWSPAEIIERNGYKRLGARWLFSGSSTGLPGVVLLPNAEPQRIFSHHAGDPLASGHANDAFDCFALLEHGGDMRAAVKAAADDMGLSRTHRDDTYERIDPETGEVLHGPSASNDDEPSFRQGIEPVDLWARYEAPELPVDLLPETIARFATRHGEVMGADAAGLAMSALAVCAAAITDEIAVQVKRNDPTWRESARLWVGLVGPPSTKKTPIMNAAMRPMKRVDAVLMRRFEAELTAYQALPPKEQKSARPPRQEQRIVSDTTVEAVQEVLKDSPRGVISSQDELSGWFGAMDKYSSSKGAMADRSFWLQSFNGGVYRVNRVVRGAKIIPNLSVGLLGGIQPEPLRALANDSHDDGLIQRLLPVILRPAGTGRDIPTDGAVKDYERLVERLDAMRPPMRQGAIALDDDRPQSLRFDDRARAVREGLEEKHLSLMQALEGVSPKLASHFGKYDGLFARLCVLWHCVEHAASPQPPVEISGSVAEKVAGFMERFLRPMAVAFYAGLLGLSAGHDDLMALASFIVARRLDEVKARDAQRSTQSFRHMTADDFRRLCEKLEAFGWLERSEPGPKSATVRWLVNPRVHEMFEARGREEIARRKAARKALRDALQG